MELTLSQIKACTSGAVRIQQESDGIHFYRFTQEQEDLYKIRKEDFYNKTFYTSGIQLRFRTNSHTLALKADVSYIASRSYFSFEIFKDNRRIGTIQNFDVASGQESYIGVLLPMGAYETHVDLGEGEKEIRILLPWSMKVALQSLTLEDGASFQPVKYEKKLLSFGDSITQGYDALYPSNKYITRLAEFFQMEEHNKAIGGEIFCPALAATKEDFTPDLITVAYGTNDWRCVTQAQFRENCDGFFRNLCQNYPDTKILAIAPIWRKDTDQDVDFDNFTDVEAEIRQVVSKYSQVTLISGYDFVPKDSQYFADLRLHPNDRGFDFYYENLIKAIQAL